ncbi:hypothetical protein I7412_32620 [Frankia sp. CN6]|uniref:Transposase (putative) YhgA-like domain-containing protein n=1 Tax=Frankia nepalensis TaxID=1836974 RepID=A0A937RSA3_9ACTN|nr:hypothetical protein [Frankia nepalensis]
MLIAMPSGEHESPIALVREDPDLVATLLTRHFGLKVPGFHHARPHPTDVQILEPRSFRADGMTVLCDAADKAKAAAVLEVQRAWDAGKKWTMPLYVAALQAELLVPVALLLYCPDKVIAGRYERMFATGGLVLRLRPFIFTPDDVPLVVDSKLAQERPSEAVLATLCHSNDADIDTAFPALVEMLRTVSPRKANAYHEMIVMGLSPDARARWELFMTSTIGTEYRSNFLRQAWSDGKAEGKVEGKAEGEAESVLAVLAARAVHVPETARERIQACADLDQLGIWLRRAATATAIDDVLS